MRGNVHTHSKPPQTLGTVPPPYPIHGTSSPVNFPSAQEIMTPPPTPQPPRQHSTSIGNHKTDKNTFLSIETKPGRKEGGRPHTQKNAHVRKNLNVTSKIMRTCAKFYVLGGDTYFSQIKKCARQNAYALMSETGRYSQ